MEGWLENTDPKKCNGDWHVRGMFFKGISCFASSKYWATAISTHSWRKQCNFTERHKIPHGLNRSKADMNTDSQFSIVFFSTFPLVLGIMVVQQFIYGKNKIDTILWRTMHLSPTYPFHVQPELPHAYGGSQWTPSGELLCRHANAWEQHVYWTCVCPQKGSTSSQMQGLMDTVIYQILIAHLSNEITGVLWCWDSNSVLCISFHAQLRPPHACLCDF